MPDNCLSGCASQFDCGKGLRKPVEGYNLAPFVRLSLSSGTSEISVGNESDPDNGNTAVIKSFQFGTSSGAGTVLEIHDQAGGSFEAVMSNLNTDIQNASRDYKMKVKWGWVDSPCGAIKGKVVSESSWFYFIPLHMDANYSEGKIKFQITGTSLMEIIFESRQDFVFNKRSLKQAIKDLFAKDEPIVKSVKFLKINPSSGEQQPWDFADNPPDGPIGDWYSNNQNKLQAAMDWMTPYLTKEHKGVTPTWNPENPTAEIIFWEDPAPKCNETIDWNKRCLGTYIVNGGKCSSVISFNPVAKWTYAALHQNSGNVPGDNSSKPIANQKEDGCNFGTPGAGSQVLTPTDQTLKDKVGPSQALPNTERGTAGHGKANKTVYSMEGELRVQGDPSLGGPRKTFGRTVSLVFINPFHVMPNGRGCGDWLANPVCNCVYSNKAWWVKAIDHSIREGSYVTTIKVALMAPGSDVNDNEPFGGNGSGGWIKGNKCSA